VQVQTANRRVIEDLAEMLRKSFANMPAPRLA